MSTFDPDAVERRVAELEQELQQPGFWDDQQRAAQVSAEHSRLSKRLERYRQLQRDYADAAELHAMDGEMAAEIEESLEPLRAELERLQEEALFNGQYDAGDAVVTVQAGGGGTEAQDWAEMLLRMYQRWAERRGFKVENAYGTLKAERGTHRLVRLSPFDQAHRRHTSFAGVIVSPLLEDDTEVEIDEGDLRIDTYRASGAGGQHVNKTDSAVRITHIPTNTVVSVQNERSQSANKQTAMKILRSRLAELAEEEREAELAKERGGATNIGFGGDAIRNYVLHPYQQAKDRRTNYEMGNTQAVLDGDIDGFIRSYLLWRAAQEGGSGGPVG